jgi:dihydroorotase-like cyclic amidohydrolase
MSWDVLIRNGDVVFPHVGPRPVDIAVAGGRIAALLQRGTRAAAAEEIDARHLVVLAGVIDPHVHQDITSSPDPWYTETRSALVGGVTTLLDFRMSGEPYSKHFAGDLAAAERSSLVDFGFQFVITSDEQLGELDRYVREYGVPTFKLLMSFKGQEGAYLGAPGIDDGVLFGLMEAAPRHRGGMVSVHTENIEVVWRLRDRLQARGRRDLAAFTESRPPFVEAEDIHKAIHYGAVTGCPVHIVHLTSREGYEAVLAARRQYPGVQVTIETCPHYLTLTCDDPAVGVRARVNPPVKYAEDREALWAALAAGGIDTVGSDHCSRDLKSKLGAGGGVDVWKTASAFPGVGTLLPLLLSEGYHKRGLSLARIAELTALNAARLYGLYPRKGAPYVGADADLVLVDLAATRRISPALVQSSCDWNLWDGWEVRGWPVLTMVRGRTAMRDGGVVAPPGTGRYLPRPVPEPSTPTTKENGS